MSQANNNNNNTTKRTRWYGFYSQQAVDAGCPISTFRDNRGTYVITGQCNNWDGRGYFWPDAIYVAELTFARCINNTYKPNQDYLRWCERA